MEDISTTPSPHHSAAPPDRPAPDNAPGIGSGVDGPRCSRCGQSLLGVALGQKCPHCGQVWKLSGIVRDLFDVDPKFLLSWRQGISAVLLAWVGGVGFAVALIKHYENVTLLISAVLYLAGVIVAVVEMRGDIPGDSIRTVADLYGRRVALARSKAMNYLLPALCLASPLSLFVTVAMAAFTQSGIGDFAGTIVIVTMLCMLALQSLISLKLSSLARLTGDDPLAQTFWHLAWASGLLAPFASAFLGFTQWVVGTRGAVPIFCMAGYLIVIALIFAQLWFAGAAILLYRSMNWAIRNASARSEREQAFRERFKALSSDPAQREISTFDRRPTRDVRLPR